MLLHRRWPRCAAASGAEVAMLTLDGRLWFSVVCCVIRANGKAVGRQCAFGRGTSPPVIVPRPFVTLAGSADIK